MSIASELTALAANKAAIKAAIEAKNPSAMPTDALAQWPTSIASIPSGGGTEVPYDAELEYVTFPAGAYVDPEIEDYGGFIRYDFEIEMRLPVDFDLDNQIFRCGNWQGSQVTSFMLWPHRDYRDMRICQSWYSPDTSPIVLNQFFKIGTHLGKIVLDDQTFSPTQSSFTLQSKAAFIICGLDDRTNNRVDANTTQSDIKYVAFTSPIGVRKLIPVRKNGVGYLYDATKNKLYGSETQVALVRGPDKAFEDTESLLAAMRSLGYDTSVFTTPDDIRVALSLPETATFQDCMNKLIYS